MEPVTLRTDRLLLRPFTGDDAEAVYEACQDADIQFYTPVPNPFTVADAAAFVGASAANGWETDTDYLFGAFRADNDLLIGAFDLEKRFPGVYELGYWAVKSQRGQGYSTEAARALCDWGWATLDVHRMEWWAMVGNTPSRALAERLGFTLEGTLRKRAIVAGEPRDWWVGGWVRP
jgi:RimJ/RimL family protein N-acetyltransferase